MKNNDVTQMAYPDDRVRHGENPELAKRYDNTVSQERTHIKEQAKKASNKKDS